MIATSGSLGAEMSEKDTDRDGATVQRGVMRRWWVRVSALLCVALLASAVAIALRHSSLLGSIERQTIDLRFTLRGSR
jgi:hypothetical protein